MVGEKLGEWCIPDCLVGSGALPIARWGKTGGPSKTHPDPEDPALEHHLAPISAFGFRVLRVVYKRGTVPPLVITAFFDRAMKGKL